jgi:hypothetical protein
MLRRFTLLTIILSILAIGTAYASAFLSGGAPGWAAWIMVVGIAALMVGMMMLGAVRRNRIGRLWIPFGFVFLVLVGGFGGALALPPIDPARATLWLGLPPGAALVLYGVGILPLLVVPVAYALTFDELTLSAADLEELRAAASAAQSRMASAPGEREGADRVEAG